MERKHTLALDGSPTHGAVKGEVRFLARTRSTVRARVGAGHDGSSMSMGIPRVTRPCTELPSNLTSSYVCGSRILFNFLYRHQGTLPSVLAGVYELSMGASGFDSQHRHENIRSLLSDLSDTYMKGSDNE